MIPKGEIEDYVDNLFEIANHIKNQDDIITIAESCQIAASLMKCCALNEMDYKLEELIEATKSQGSVTLGPH